MEINTFILKSIQKAILSEKLDKTSKIKRFDIKFIINKMNDLMSNKSFDNYISIIENIKNKNMNEYKNLWIMCFIRSIFENMYIDNITYKKPEYAIKIALGDNPYNVFLNSIDKKDYVYLSKDVLNN